MKEIIKISVEINEMESKRTIQRINEANSWYLKRLARLTNYIQTSQKNGREDPN
jgi:hypothetical protein